MIQTRPEAQIAGAAEHPVALPTRCGMTLHVRTVVAEDEPVMAALFAALSPEDLRHRFLSAIRQVDPARIRAMTRVDHDRTESFLAYAEGEAVAAAMLVIDEDGVEGEVAVVVRSDLKGHGIGWTMLEHLLRHARARRLKAVRSIEAGDNVATIALEREMGFAVRQDDCAHEMIATRPLADA
jgi:acetyltransferase